MRSASQKPSTAKELEQYFAEEFALHLVPALSSFAFVGIHHTHFYYDILQYDFLHCLSLAVEKLLEDCNVFLLYDDQKTELKYGMSEW